MASDVVLKPGKAPRPAPLPPPENTYHRLRKRFHLLCFVVFVALPFFNVMRFDIPKQRFYFAGYELWISEFGILFLSLMFLMFLIVAVSMIYGRLYCSYACPQMIFSEASQEVEGWIRKTVNRKLISLSAAWRQRITMTAFYGVLGLASVFLAFVFISYFVEPRDLLGRLLTFDLQTAGGISGATVTLLTFLDFAFVRQRFCTSVCPYGYLQGMLTDDNTLLVHYRDGQKACIECKKCVRVCQMGIDIRQSPFQIECIHCGECIDACDEVLARIGRKGLIHYVWGEQGGVLGETAEPWYRRLGLRDAKRVVVMLLLLGYLCGLLMALSLRKPVLVQVSPDRSTLYRVDGDGAVRNGFRLRLANRSSQPARVEFGIDGLPGAKLLLPDNPVALAPGEQTERHFDIAMRRFAAASEVNHFLITTRTVPDQGGESFAMTFLLPPEKKP